MSAWAAVLDRRTPFALLDGIAETQAQPAIDDLRRQLDADPDFTPADRERAMAQARPLIVANAKAVLTEAWQRLQLEGGAIH